MTHLRMTLALCFVCVAALLNPAAAQTGPPIEGGPPGMGGSLGPGGPSFLENVFPPGLIMRHQSEIGLTDAQRETITKQMEETEKALVTLQWDVERESEKLSKLLAAGHVDEAAALRQADLVMGAEERLKKAHLTLLIRIKNDLTAAQQEKLRQLRPERHGSPRASD
jgi:Spy/CpxP family protein refolding chaperone